MIPTSTYRLQLRTGMTLNRAEALVPYFDALGIGAVYLSPPFTAAPGSTHGYDVADPNEIDPALGGRPALESLSRALHARKMGLILDIVPNHMAFSVETPWLRDVLRHGEDSRYAGHFDIAWPARLRLPWLDGPFDAADWRVDGEARAPILTDGTLRIPLASGAQAEAARTDPGDIAALHDAQAWQLVDWRTEGAAITHRRFFSITSLIGMRVEDPVVFDDMHALLIDLAQARIIDGVRVDHIDGLADPAAYLDRLNDALGLPIWVEKILTGDETLPEDWETEGTTGYVAARDIAAVLTDPAGAEARRRGQAEAEARNRSPADWTGGAADFDATVARAKRSVLQTELAAELDQLTDLAIAAADAAAAPWGREAMRAVVLSLVTAFPRYRTYGTEEGLPLADALLLDRVLARSDGPRPLRVFLSRALKRTDPASTALRLRLQQVTGAAIAKAREDTAFYRDVTLLSANEVGAEPERPAIDPSAFHDAMERRLRSMPKALTLTSSHDTKRSGDARMRIAALSHHPAVVGDVAHRLSKAHPKIGARMSAYLAQSAVALLGAPEAATRLSEHVVKALREGKDQSSWTAPDTGAEAAAQAAAPDALTLAAGARGIEAVLGLADRLMLAQAALMLTVPGIPDIYQGTERMELALTDPDNRRPPDWAALEGALMARGDPRVVLTRRLLHLRRDRPALFGGYERLPAEAGTLAFLRKGDGGALHVTVATGPGVHSSRAPGTSVFGAISKGEADLRDVPVAISVT